MTPEERARAAVPFRESGACAAYADGSTWFNISARRATELHTAIAAAIREAVAAETEACARILDVWAGGQMRCEHRGALYEHAATILETVAHEIRQRGAASGGEG